MIDAGGGYSAGIETSVPGIYTTPGGIVGTVPIASGGTGQTTAGAALTALGGISTVSRDTTLIGDGNATALGVVPGAGFMGPVLITITGTGYNLGGANQTNVWGIALPTLSLTQGFSVQIGTLDAGGLYSFGVYNAAGNLVAHTAPAAITGTGIQNYAWTSTPILIPAGIYFIAFTGNATTAHLLGAGANTGHAITYASGNNVAGGSTTGGALNASITVPTYAPLQSGMIMFAIY